MTFSTSPSAPVSRSDAWRLVRNQPCAEIEVRAKLPGSAARDSAHEDSDVDVLVSFAGSASSAQYFGVLFYLEDVLGCTVDFVTQKALRREIRPYVEREALRV